MASIRHLKITNLFKNPSQGLCCCCQAAWNQVCLDTHMSSTGALGDSGVLRPECLLPTFVWERQNKKLDFSTSQLLWRRSHVQVRFRHQGFNEPQVYGKGGGCGFLPQTRPPIAVHTVSGSGFLNTETEWSCLETTQVLWYTELWGMCGSVGNESKAPVPN